MTNIFLSVFEISVSVSVIVMIQILLTPFLNKRYSAKWKYWIWIFLAVRLLIPFGRADGQYMIGQWLQEKDHTDITQEQEAVPGQIIVEIPTQMTAPIAIQSEKSDISITLLDIAAYVWLFGSLAILALYLISYSHYRSQMIKKGNVIENADILQQISELKRELHIKDAVRVVEYSEAASPMIIGLFKPVLVLPETQYRSEEMFFILKHELVRLKRKDVFFKLLFAAAHAVHWFNPLIWLMQKEAAVDMELSCVERVMQGTGYAVKKAYTETLLSMLYRQCAKRTFLSTQFYGGKRIMKKRFKNILVKKEKKNGIYVLICAVLLTFCFGTLVGCTTAKENSKNIPEQPEKEEYGHDENNNEDSTPLSSDDGGDDTEIPQNGQIHGYITKYDSGSVTVDRQLWITAGSAEWKPEYDEDAGFEVVDAEGEDITYSLSEDGTYSVLENHQGPVKELTRTEFENYLQEMDAPVLWSMELEDGKIKSCTEQYRP